MSDKIPSLDAKIAFRRASTLGEGSLWDAAQELLYWVDIAEHKVCVFDPKDASHREFDVGEDVGTVVVTKNEKLLVALRSGLAVFDPATAGLRHLNDPRSSESEGRFNDGKCDPAGRLWVGTMAEGAEAAGKAVLYCVDKDLMASAKVPRVTCSNGLCWSADTKTFYYIDTPTYQVLAFDFDAHTGALANRRVCIQLSRAEGAPDGMTIDAEGQLWIALFDGGRVLRIDPKNGERTFQVRIPGGGNVTSCAFGGKELDHLYITTARIGLTPEERSLQPDAGSLFGAQVPFTGALATRFGSDL